MEFPLAGNSFFFPKKKKIAGVFFYSLSPSDLSSLFFFLMVWRRAVPHPLVFCVISFVTCEVRHTMREVFPTRVARCIINSRVKNVFGKSKKQNKKKQNKTKQIRKKKTTSTDEYEGQRW